MIAKTHSELARALRVDLARMGAVRAFPLVAVLAVAVICGLSVVLSFFVRSELSGPEWIVSLPGAVMSTAIAGYIFCVQFADEGESGWSMRRDALPLAREAFVRMRYVSALVVALGSAVVGALLSGAVAGVADVPAFAGAGVPSVVLAYGYVTACALVMDALALPFFELRSGLRRRWVPSVLAFMWVMMATSLFRALVVDAGLKALLPSVMSAASVACLVLLIAVAALMVSYGVALRLARKREW